MKKKQNGDRYYPATELALDVTRAVSKNVYQTPAKRAWQSTAQPLMAPLWGNPAKTSTEAKVTLI